jgi:hypothetical protein
MAANRIRLCVQDIIDATDTGMTAEEISYAQKRIDLFFSEVDERFSHSHPAEEVDRYKMRLRAKLVDAAGQIDTPVGASDLLGHAIYYFDIRAKKTGT